MTYGAPLPIILREVVRPALQLVGIWSDAREQIVLGTGACESAYKYVKQIGDGPALGWFQCEPATHKDLLTNYVYPRKDLLHRLRMLCEGLERDGALIAFPQYAAAVCGIHYLRAKGALPAAGDAQGMAEYHKSRYNGPGKADPTETVVHFRNAIEACK